MKTWKVFWGIGFILVAVALVLDAVGVLAPIASAIGPISILACAAALLLLSYIIAQLSKGKFGEIFIPLALIFMLFERNVAFVLGLESEDIINNWLLLGCAAMLWIGFAILLSGSKGKRRKHVHNGYHSTGNLGSSVKYINCDGFRYESVENNLGSFTVFFENTDKYVSGGILDVENNLGQMKIKVPSHWHVVMQVDSSLGTTSTAEDNPTGPILTVRGDNNLGNISVETI